MQDNRLHPVCRPCKEEILIRAFLWRQINLPLPDSDSMSEYPSPQKMSPKDLMIVIVIALGSFMAGLDATIVNIALPAIAKSFEISTVMASWVLNAYLIIQPICSQQSGSA